MTTSTDPQPHDPPLVPGPAAARPAQGAHPARAPYPNERTWRRIFHDGDRTLHRVRRGYGWLPSPPRCAFCHVPFAGPGGALMRLAHSRPSRHNPRYCNRCELAIRQRPGATDLPLAILYADVRGSTTFAERAEHAGHRPAYVERIHRFVAAVCAVLEETDGFILNAVADEVVGVYPPGLCGPDYAARAIAAATRLCRLGAAAPGDDAPLPFGVGVDTGEVFLGNKFSDAERLSEIELATVRVIGDHMNVAARLASAAAAGEALVSEATMAAATVRPLGLERRRIRVAGREESVDVHVLRGA